MNASPAVAASVRLVLELTKAGYTDIRPAAGRVYFSGPDGDECWAVSLDMVREVGAYPGIPLKGGRFASTTPERDQVATLMWLLGDGAAS